MLVHQHVPQQLSGLMERITNVEHNVLDQDRVESTHVEILKIEFYATKCIRQRYTAKLVNQVMSVQNNLLPLLDVFMDFVHNKFKSGFERTQMRCMYEPWDNWTCIFVRF